MRRHSWSKLVILLAVVLLLGAVPAAAFAGFADVPADAWYAPAVQTCAEKGLFQGTSPTTFSPDLSMTRGMFVTVLGRMENIDPTQADASGFMDVPEDAYYAGYVGWAARSGIVAGVSDSVFEPERGISRQEICTIVHRYLVWKDVSLQTVPSAQFADDAQIAEWAKESVYVCRSAGIVCGVGDNHFAPNVAARRCEAAQIFKNLLAVLEDPVEPQPPVIRYVAHRGYHVQAPENTMPAFAAAAEAGYQFLESDVHFTKDGVAVLCHDSTINATARNADGSKIVGVKSIQFMTYEELLQYDFGIAAGEAYRGTRIPTFREWIAFCREADVTPYIELKSRMTTEQVQTLMQLVEEAGMTDRVVWISFTWNLRMLQDVVAANPEAEVGLLSNGLANTTVAMAKTLQTGQNRVFLDVLHTAVNRLSMQLAAQAGLEVEAYTVNDAELADALTSLGVVGITTNTLLPAATTAEPMQLQDAEAIVARFAQDFTMTSELEP
jgi:glycerophosphoryl diester phosphodiesterase